MRCVCASGRIYSLPPHTPVVPTSCHRHPCSSVYRPLKIQFGSTTDRNNFIIGFNKTRKTEPSISTIASKPRIQRDLTKEELAQLKEARKFCYDQNKLAQKSIYIVRDISYVSNPKPTPFRVA
uniref:Uncharacterized protein n=1 Tax=Caenorhabditis japonica TaxID=281687 RepID=A0A8R1EKJ1_CAEJA